ncbi:hypothetical protein Poli38472_008313 [Pythium oligandrum]|uniref:glucan endo-1,3-beta-D-glucosidase n=1 Tax=Pythium oligandrum TaxID=41045 RepID=A0A8K1FK54_PYTOL|nr:hypothetical protein Poli38472_008313 [Pythium oligandrum]|eukprot:TMW65671.1 hypothetical protein Poli38472_008313 [Pythium oligandrum]
MKSLLLTIVAGVASICSVAAQGVCYDPDHVSPVTTDSINSDLATIRNQGFKAVRTYTVQHGNNNLGKLIVQNGLNASLTIPFDNANPSNSEVHIKAAIEAAHFTNGAARVTHIWVGNENLASVNEVPQPMFDFIGWVRSSVPAGVLVGTVQRSTEYLEPSRAGIYRWNDLIATSDVAGINIHPVFNPNTRADQAIGVVDSQWGRLYSEETRQRFPSLTWKLVITEVGWPTEGYWNGNSGSKEGAMQFMNDYKAWRAHHIDAQRSFYFQAFDLPSRSNDGPFEAYFGVMYADRSPKYNSYTYMDM